MLDIKVTGQLLAAHTAEFKDQQGKDVLYGKVQVLVEDDAGFFSITTVKVQSDKFGVIPSWQPMIGKKVTMPLNQKTYEREMPNGNTKTVISLYLEESMRVPKAA